MNKGETKSTLILKRILSLLITNIMLVSLFAPYSVVFATEGEDTQTTPKVIMELTTTSTTVTQNDLIEVKLKLTSVPSGLNVINFDIEYDKDVLQVYYSEEDGNYIYSGKQQWQADYIDDYVTLNRGELFGEAEEELNKVIFTITFKALKNAETTQVSIANVETAGGPVLNYPGEAMPLIIGNVPEVPQTHIVTYNYIANGGESVTINDIAQTTNNTLEVSENSQIDLTPVANKEGYTFIGWNTDKDATVGLTAEEAIMGTSDVELFAIFSKTVIATSHYYDNIGVEQTILVNGVMYNNDTDVEIILPTLTQDYTDTNGKTWTKKGWTTETTANVKNILTENASVTITADADYYMVYERNLNITYDTNGGTIAPTAPIGLKATVNTSDITNIEGSKLTITNTTPVKAGYEFENAWTTNSDGTGTSYTTGEEYTFTDDCTLYAKWNANTYTIKYNGNENDSENSIMPDTTYVYESNESTGVNLSANIYTKAGYRFEGWATTPDATNPEYEDENLMLNEDIIEKSNNDKEIILYAIWGEVTYNITYVSDPEGLTLPTTNPTTYESSNGIITLANPEVAGYTFIGWTDNKTVTIPVTTYEINTLTDDIEITAHFEAKEYTISYNGNGNTSQETSMEDDKYIFATEGLTLKSNTYTKEGYEFKGWATTPDASEAEYEDEQTIQDNDILEKEIEGTITLYAVWGASSNTPYTVEHYRQNTDGTYPTIPNETESLTGITDTQATAKPKTTAEYIGYVVDEDRTSTQNTGTITADGNLVLKIYYKTAEYTVTFDVNGADPLANNTKVVKYGQAYGNMPTPTWDGHTFLGWFDSQTDGTKIEDTTIVTQTKDHILYANWDIKTYTVEFIGKINDGSPEGIDSVIKSVQVSYGDNIIPAQLGIDLEALKQAVVTPKYTYTVNTQNPFNGDLTTPVTDNRQININYNTPTINKYTVTFYNEGADPQVDTPLGTDIVDYGSTASDARINPVKQEDNTYTYQFARWVDINNNIDDLSNVIDSRDVYATYTPVYKNYEVTFLDEDGITKISEKLDYHYNDILTVPANPTKPQTAEYSYEFEGWIQSTDPEETIVDLNNMRVTQNRTYKAKYRQVKRQYTVTFLDEDKLAVLGTSTVDYGTSATAPEVHDKQDGVGYNYVFDKWVIDLDASPQVEADLSNVIENANVYATYTKTPISYKIKYEGTMDAANPNKVSYTVEDEDFTLLPLGQKVGMEFKGWYTDTTYTTQITSIEISKMDKTNLNDVTVYAKWEIQGLMYFVKESASDDNATLEDNRIYDNFDNAKEYVDTLFNEGEGIALGIYDLNNDLVYFPEVKTKLYYVKENETIENETLSADRIYDDFDLAKQYVDNLFEEGTIIRIYDQNNKLIYEPKQETPKVQYFVKVNKEDENTDDNTFDNFSDAKIFADENVENKVKVYDINGEIVYEPQEKLYLRTQTYKIGENKLDEYEENDLYLYRVNANTSFAEFKTSPNCITNGNITVYKQDGSILKDNEIVGTGMTLKDELNGQIITLTISVIGDTDGDGIVTAADLADTVQKTIDNINLNMLQFKAIDMDEDNQITAADLADEIKLSLI